MRKLTKFESKWGIENANKEWGKVSKLDSRAHSRDRRVSSLRGFFHYMKEVSRVLKEWLLLEYVMVVERETTYGGLAHYGAHSRLDLNLREVPSSSR